MKTSNLTEVDGPQAYESLYCGSFDIQSAVAPGMCSKNQITADTIDYDRGHKANTTYNKDLAKMITAGHSI